MKKKWIVIPAIVVAVFIVIILVGSFVAEEPLRRYLEGTMKDNLTGFSVQIKKLTLHPFTLSADIENVWIYQKEHPDPPVLHAGNLHGGLRLLPLFAARVVTHAKIDNPSLYVNLSNLEPLLKQKTAVKKEEWQDQLEAMRRITISDLRINNGDITFQQSPKGQPIRVTAITFEARNIENVKSAEGIYPASLTLDALLSGKGRLRMNAQADLMLKPLPGVKANVELQGLDLSVYREMAKLFSVRPSKGTLSLDAHVEYTPKRKRVDVRKLTLQNPEIDYIYAPQPGEQKPVTKPPVEIRAEQILILQGNFGLVNKTANPTYRIFMDTVDLEVRNFSTKFSQGPASLYLKGRFMGTGDTIVSGTFRSEAQGPDFNMKIAINNTDMRDMNNLFRAYGKFDVARGFFSFYSELTVKDNKVTGYVKPLFKDMKVYDKRKDEEKSQFRKLYQKAIEGVAKLLENKPRKAVATETPVEGSIANPKAGTGEALVNLIRNAFSQAILPGFEENIKK